MSSRRKTTSRTPKRIIHARLRGDAHKDGTYDALLAAQAGYCGTCPRLESAYVAETGRKFDIDHDHATHQIRGLLCRGCNMRLRRGMTPAWLRAAADYLERGSRDTQA